MKKVQNHFRTTHPMDSYIQAIAHCTAQSASHNNRVADVEMRHQCQRHDYRAKSPETQNE